MFVVVAVSESRVEAIAIANRWTDASKARDTYLVENYVDGEFEVGYEDGDLSRMQIRIGEDIVEDLIISSGVPAV